MYRQLSELVVRVADLVEAEGRSLRAVLARLGMAVVFGVIGGVMALVGVVLVVVSAWVGLNHSVGPTWASAISGVVALSIAAALLLGALRLSK